MSDFETLALVALLQADRARWADIRIELEKVPASYLLKKQDSPALFDDSVDRAIAMAEGQIAQWEREGITLSSIYSDDYPAQLRTVHDYPPILFSRGHFSDEDNRAVAIVGTRAPSVGALRFIDDVVPLIAADNHPIVSGLAKGVDAAAMSASLGAGNRTIGIIGTGIHKSYPKENVDLQERVAQEHLLLSQFWPDAPPTQQSFPMRNHVMSAFSSMTLIIEAGENSGTRIQARAATKHARPVIITRAVYQSTNWAKELVARQLDVTVVSTPAEARDAIREISGRDELPPVWSERTLTATGA